MSQTNIPFIDLAAQRRRLGPLIEEAFARVLAHGQYILGPEVRALEGELAAFAGVPHVVSCASGTDALVMPLRAWEVRRDDAVFVPSFTFCATAEAVVLAGATPVFCDVDAESFTLDPQSLERGIKAAREQGLRPRAVIPVDLFGHAADYDALLALARSHGLLVLDDAAQGFGGSYKGKRIGALADVCATSFFPAKPLGCYGDGGAIFTQDEELTQKLLAIRVHGQEENKLQKRIEHRYIGITGRLDTLQAAVLLEKLKIFEGELHARDIIAARYNALLSAQVKTPRLADGIKSAWAQYTIRLPDRDRVRAKLVEAGIPTAIYYALPLHRQPAYEKYPCADALPVTEEICADVLSLPMHPYLDEDVQARIVDALKKAL